jgi:ABC-type amino acid transport substrate-binding protein
LFFSAEAFMQLHTVNLDVLGSLIDFLRQYLSKPLLDFARWRPGEAFLSITPLAFLGVWWLLDWYVPRWWRELRGLDEPERHPLSIRQRPRSLALYFVLASLVAGASILAARYADIPEPIFLEKPVTVFAEDAILKWKPVEAGEGETVFYDIEYSENEGFSGKTKRFTVPDTILLLQANRNKTLYWRVRVALQWRDRTDLIRHGSWSAPLKVEQYETALERIADRKELRIGVEETLGRSSFRYLAPAPNGGAGLFPPASQFRGFEPKLADEIANALGREPLSEEKCSVPRPGDSAGANGAARAIRVSFVPMDWEGLLRGLYERRFDILISTLTRMEGREARYGLAFTEKEYHRTGYAVLFRKGHEAQAQDFVDKKWLGNSASVARPRVLVEEETTSEDCLGALLSGPDTGLSLCQAGKSEAASKKLPLEVTCLTKTISELRTPLCSGNVDLIITDESHAVGMTKKYSDMAYKLLGESFFGTDKEHCKSQHYHIAVRAGEYCLKRAIDAVLADSKRLKELENEAATNFGNSVKSRNACLPETP